MNVSGLIKSSHPVASRSISRYQRHRSIFGGGLDEDIRDLDERLRENLRRTLAIDDKQQAIIAEMQSHYDRARGDGQKADITQPIHWMKTQYNPQDYYAKKWKTVEEEQARLFSEKRSLEQQMGQLKRRRLQEAELRAQSERVASSPTPTTPASPSTPIPQSFRTPGTSQPLVDSESEDDSDDEVQNQFAPRDEGLTPQGEAQKEAFKYGKKKRQSRGKYDDVFGDNVYNYTPSDYSRFHLGKYPFRYDLDNYKEPSNAGFNCKHSFNGCSNCWNKYYFMIRK